MDKEEMTKQDMQALKPYFDWKQYGNSHKPSMQQLRTMRTYTYDIINNQDDVSEKIFEVDDELCNMYLIAVNTPTWK